jgi:hypothetical protein
MVLKTGIMRGALKIYNSYENKLATMKSFQICPVLMKEVESEAVKFCLVVECKYVCFPKNWK